MVACLPTLLSKPAEWSYGSMFAMSVGILGFKLRYVYVRTLAALRLNAVNLA